jgi:hypothetical protein
MSTEWNMQPAKMIVQSLGGPSAVAKELGITPGGVCRWYMPKPKGAGGRVPGKYVPQLCAMARRLDLFLEPNIFYEDRDTPRGSW